MGRKSGEPALCRLSPAHDAAGTAMIIRQRLATTSVHQAPAPSLFDPSSKTSSSSPPLREASHPASEASVSWRSFTKPVQTPHAQPLTQEDRLPPAPPGPLVGAPSSRVVSSVSSHRRGEQAPSGILYKSIIPLTTKTSWSPRLSALPQGEEVPVHKLGGGGDTSIQTTAFGLLPEASLN